MAEFFFAFDDKLQSFDFGGQLASDDEAALYNAVVASLFTDGRARIDDRLPGEPRNGPAPAEIERDRRGWHADPRLGSRRWEVDREKQVEQVRAAIEMYDREALQWLIDDKVCSRIDVAASFPAPGVVLSAIVLYRPAVPALTFRFQYLWQSLGGFHAVQ